VWLCHRSASAKDRDSQKSCLFCCRMGRTRRGRRFLLFDQSQLSHIYGMVHQFAFSVLDHVSQADREALWFSALYYLRAAPHRCLDTLVFFYHLVFFMTLFVNHPYHYFIFFVLAPLSLGWNFFYLEFFILVSWHRRTTASFVSRSSSTLLSALVLCSSFMCHMCVMFPFLRGDLLFFLSASLGGDGQLVWNFRGDCHCRDIAQGSDRMISLYISRALLSLPMLYPWYFYQWKSVPKF